MSGPRGGAPIGGYIDAVSREQSALDDLVNRSAAFIESMLRPIRHVTTTGSITPDQIYAPSHVGPVSGFFSPRDVALVREQRSFVTVADPVEPVDPNFKGQFWGRVVDAPPPLHKYRVEAGKETDAFYPMRETDPDTSVSVEAPAIADVDVAGYFMIDVAAKDAQAGPFVIRLLDVDDAEVGMRWPNPETLVGLEVQYHVNTDTDYLVGRQPARADGRFEFAFGQPGEKRFTLNRVSDDALLADFSIVTGNVRSYLVEPGDPGYGTNFQYQCYTYDQAICLLAAIALGRGDLAQSLVRGLLRLQYDGAPYDGGFFFSGQQLAPQETGDPSFRTGAHAIAAYALIKYAESYPHDATYDYAGAAVRALDFTGLYLAPFGDPLAGLYKGGSGIYHPPPDAPNLDPGNLTWASVEHNFDCFHMFRAAGTVIHPTWFTQADALQAAIMEKLWSPALGRFYQGMKEDGAPDSADPLDAHSWGSMFMRAIGDSRALSIIQPPEVAPHKCTMQGRTGMATGYGPAYDDGNPNNYPNILPNVWAEGTMGLALAYGLSGDIGRWLTTIVDVLPARYRDGAFPYVVQNDPSYELTPSRAVIGSAWSILAVLRRGVWDDYVAP